MNPVQLTQHKPLTNFEQLRNVKSVDLTILSYELLRCITN